jgi:ketosteroid isomerase-like protein
MAGDGEIVRGWYAATEGRLDSAAVAYWYDDILHPEVDWRAVEGSLDDSGVMKGRERVRRYFEELLEAFENIVIEPLEIEEVGERVVMEVHFTGRSRGAGVPTELRFWVTYLVRDGKLASVREYLSHDDAIAAASLPAS